MIEEGSDVSGQCAEQSDSRYLTIYGKGAPEPGGHRARAQRKVAAGNESIAEAKGGSTDDEEADAERHSYQNRVRFGSNTDSNQCTAQHQPGRAILFLPLNDAPCGANREQHR